MTLAEAQNKAQQFANDTGNSVLVCLATHRANREDVDQQQEYGIALTLPTFAIRVGERFYPSEPDTI